MTIISRESSPVLCWTEIDLNAIKYNLQQIQRLAKFNSFQIPSRKNLVARKKFQVDILAVVKANAYGHGYQEVVPLLERSGVNRFAVSDVKEGIGLRGLGLAKPILLLESSLTESVPLIIRHHLTPTVCDLRFALAMNQYAKKFKVRVPVHIKVDTGMGRLGIWHLDAFDFIYTVYRNCPNLILEGIFTHFPAADTDRSFTDKQIRDLYQLVLKLDRSGLIIPYIHASNSMGLADYRTKVLNLVRPGLMIYGLYPDKKLKGKISLRPAMSVKAKVIFVKKISKGRSISYGRTFIARRSMTVATVPIGYNDGYLRSLSNRSIVLIRGKECPILGRVTMDQIVVDVSKVPSVESGDTVVILGRQGRKEISAERLADFAGTINYEVICGLGNRLPCLYR